MIPSVEAGRPWRSTVASGATGARDSTVSMSARSSCNSSGPTTPWNT